MNVTLCLQFVELRSVLILLETSPVHVPQVFKVTHAKVDYI